jgi:glycerol-3-phosphate acyltransferase PlsX
MRIAVDAMGGDHAPREIVKGAAHAARDLPGVTRVILVGDRDAIERELSAHGKRPAKIEISHASEVVGMGEAPAQAIRRKKDSSVSRAVDLVKAGEADAVLSAGNTGALVVAATLKLRTLAGVDRPALAAVMPTVKRPFVLIDAGANPDCAAKLLLQFAIMGSVYAKVILGQERPVVGLMGIGVEDSKGGNETTREAFGLLRSSPLNFRGNVEGYDLFRGDTDVVVCDGFAGNVVLKTTEATARAIGHWMRQEFTAGVTQKLGALLLRQSLRRMKAKLDPESYGGAPLLGVNGICIKTHGSSSAKAVFHGIRVASESAHGHINRQIEEWVAKAAGANA